MPNSSITTNTVTTPDTIGLANPPHCTNGAPMYTLSGFCGAFD